MPPRIARMPNPTRAVTSELPASAGVLSESAAMPIAAAVAVILWALGMALDFPFADSSNVEDDFDFNTSIGPGGAPPGSFLWEDEC